ncbi:hypothetical protein EC9_40500 [Rosistilla ulvae]|uniref:Bacterial membrane protein YfhO n=1 Tax=Rosistilla ulvae TaxID=1930277 RepID=A0A517M4Q8_9BACT|nr:hypothetical protein [Rosistilla ulvae]QDS89849.1 hypothetical protein EC9_40500 [Rosistilla ulvae]
MKAFLIPLGLLTLSLGAILYPALSGDRRLAFRDVSHFYQPLYRAIDARISAGDLPLWNPLDQFGLPVAGETTTALFYPGRLVFHLGLDAPQSLAVYIYLHLILAGLSVFWIARRYHGSVAASALAGVVYAAGGPVLFLYTNPPFLVGAAWLPLAAGFLVEAVHRWNRVSFAIGSMALAMMLLGGDVQSAAQVIVFLLGYVLLRAIRRMRVARRQTRLAGDARLGTKMLLGGTVLRLMTIGLAIGLASGAASLQIIPSWQWSQQSVRRHSPSSGVAQLTAAEPYVAAPSAWWQAPAAGTHQANVYDFSVGPWQWIGALLPGVCGEMFPENTRITRLLPSEGKTWTPSLFLGVLPAICLLIRLPIYLRRLVNRQAQRGRGNPLRIWDGMILAGLVFSLGGFGLVWAVRELAYLFGGAMILNDCNAAVGGPYWFLVSFVPGYANFRFPAKWLVFFSLGLALLTAHMVDRLARGSRDRWSGASVSLIGISVLALLISLLPIGSFGIDLSPAADSFFGPLNLSLWQLQAFWAAVHAALFATIVLVLCRRCPPSSRVLPIALLALTLIELTLHGRGLIGTASAPSDSKLAEMQRTTAPLRRVISLAAAPRWPERWGATSPSATPDPRNLRLEQVEHGQQLSLFMRWHLDAGIAKLNSPTSISHWRGPIFWDAVRPVLADSPPDQTTDRLRRLCQLLGADATLQPRVAQPERGPTASTEAPLQIRLDARVRNPDAAPIELVDDWRVVAPSEIVAVLPEHVRDYLTDATQASLLESESESLRTDLEPIPTVSELEIEEHQPERTLSHVEVSHPTLVKFFQIQDGNWTARYRATGGSVWHQATSHPVDFVSQGFEVPAGNWQVEFRYRPTWLVPASAISLFGWGFALWLLAAGFGCWRCARLGA